MALELAGSGSSAERKRAGPRGPALSLPIGEQLELLRQADVVVTIPDRVERRIVVVVERAEDRRRLAIEHVVHADRQAGAPEHPLPDRGRGGFGDRCALAVLGFLHIRSRFRWRLHELIRQLHVERDVARHCPSLARIQDREITEEVRVIPEVADVVAGRDEVEVSPLPFATDETLVPRNRTRSQRLGAVVVVAQEAEELLARSRLCFPREEVVLASREGELAPTLGRDFVNRGRIDTLHKTRAGVLEVGIDRVQGAVRVTGDTVSRATRSGRVADTVTEAVWIDGVLSQQHLSEAGRAQD